MSTQRLVYIRAVIVTQMYLCRASRASVMGSCVQTDQCADTASATCRAELNAPVQINRTIAPVRQEPRLRQKKKKYNGPCTAQAKPFLYARKHPMGGAG